MHEGVAALVNAMLPPAMQGQDAGPIIEQGMQKNWVLAAMVEQTMFWDTGTSSVDAMLEHMRPFTLVGLETCITCPTLCTSGTGEGELAVSQARQVFDALWVQPEHLQVGRFPPDIVQTLSGLPLLSVNEITADDQLLRTSITKDEGRGKVCL